MLNGACKKIKYKTVDQKTDGLTGTVQERMCENLPEMKRAGIEGEQLKKNNNGDVEPMLKQ